MSALSFPKLPGDVKDLNLDLDLGGRTSDFICRYAAYCETAPSIWPASSGLVRVPSRPRARKWEGSFCG